MQIKDNVRSLIPTAHNALRAIATDIASLFRVFLTLLLIINYKMQVQYPLACISLAHFEHIKTQTSENMFFRPTYFEDTVYAQFS